MTLDELKVELDGVRKDSKEKTEAFNRAEAELKKGNTELTEKVGKMELEARAAQVSLDGVMRALAAPGIVPGNAGDKKGSELAKKAMDLFMRGRDSEMTVEMKALIVGDQGQGGILVPTDRAQRIIELASEVSPIRAEATVMRTVSDELEIVKETGQMSAGWADEQTTRTADTATRFGIEKIPVHYQTILQPISRKMLSDSAVDLEAYVAAKVAKRMGVGEGTAFVSGATKLRPQGMLFGSLVTRVQSSTAASGQFAPDDVLDAEANLISTYAKAAKWITHRMTLNFIRKFKDNENRYLGMVTLDSLKLQAEGTRQMLLDGYPVIEAPDMSQNASAADVGIFADIKELYTIVDRENMVLIRDIYSAKLTGMVEYLFERRVGGQVVNAAAGRVLRCRA